MSLPSYLHMAKEELQARAEQARELLSECRLCPRECGVNRLAGETGFCRSGALAKVASANLHFGEEPPISGGGGSGTVFFSRCNLRCAFCQNFPISQMGHGKEFRPDRLARSMVALQRRGAENINLVTAMHFAPQVLEALVLARDMGLRIPIVSNTNAYEKVETLKLFEGVVDVYLPDIKYADDAAAEEFSQAPRYWEISTAAVREMFRQVGFLEVDERGMAMRGLIVRHLVLPGGLSGAGQVLRFIAEELSPKVQVSLMTQYFPAYRAFEYDKISNRIDPREAEEALNHFAQSGLEQCFFQEDGDD